MLQDVAAGQDENGVAKGEIGAVGGDVEEAVAFGDSGEVAGTLPAERLDRWRDGGPIEASGKKMGQAGFFVERLAEMGLQKWKRRGRRT